MNSYNNEKYNVAIIGGGVTGAAILYVLSNYTNINSIALIEKEWELGQVASHYKNNSQTLHFGDIETNYTLEKAKRVKEAAEILVVYLERFGRNIFRKTKKMVLAVGEEEAEQLEKRYKEFKPLFPKIKKISHDEIELIEPKITEGRRPEEKLLAILTDDGYIVNYQKLSESFIEESLKSGKKISVIKNTEARSVLKSEYCYIIKTPKAAFESKIVAICAGPYSLIFAKNLGYGKNFGILPVAGSFYTTKNVFNNKVYTVQNPELPFAAVHGDPDINNPDETRFGPTAKVLPLLERYKYRTFFDFLKISAWNIKGIIVLFKIITDKTIFIYIIKNLLYDLPVIGKWFFLQTARKIVPSLKFFDLIYGKRLGGIRPQLVNVQTGKMEMGEAKITGDKIIFNITPSPGASVCLKNAEQDAIKIIKFLGAPFKFEIGRWCKDFKSTMAACKE